jgi:hypothetical protein
MAIPALSSRKTAISASLAAVLAVGVAAYVTYAPAESEVLPAQPPATAAAAAQAPATPPASASASASAAASTATSSAPHKQRSKEQAAAALMALPELQAWSAMLEKESHGKAHGALIEYDPAPRKIRGKSYWQFSFVENTEDAALRWESFLASSSDDEILVEDSTTDELLTLERWRKEKQPSKRHSIDG